ncbi:MAG: hypothetical protein JWO67_713 [Streptosporangiaceae bacterium]|jgi:hypothetical protein|nr:hypothetical protein [Streptosporangiaceae bacterium]
MATRETQTRSAATAVDMGLIGIYLNDHLAGATAGVELVQRAARSQRGWEAGRILDRLAREIKEDRAELISMIIELGVPIRRYKVALGWITEKAGRLKLNGRLLGRSPLSDVVELEGLRLGVIGKEACWRALRTLAERDRRLDPERLEGLISRASRQAETLEELRVRAFRRLLGLD